MSPPDRSTFALDENFPQPILREAIDKYVLAIEVVPLSELDPGLLGAYQDDELISELAGRRVGGLITCDDNMVFRPEVPGVVQRSRFSLVTCRRVGDDPVRLRPRSVQLSVRISRLLQRACQCRCLRCRGSLPHAQPLPLGHRFVIMNYRDIAKAAKEQGWRSEAKKSGAEMWYSPDGETLVLWHATPSDRRALRNFLAKMRRGGLRWPAR